MFEIGQATVNWLLIPVIVTINLIINILISRYALKIIFPQMSQAISSGMSALQSKGVDVRLANNMEKAITGDLLDQFPEVTAILEHFSPETAEMIRKNPQIALSLIQRYKPMLDKFMPMLTGGQTEQPKQYDL